jgi:hypothetical protein
MGRRDDSSQSVAGPTPAEASPLLPPGPSATGAATRFWGLAAVGVQLALLLLVVHGYEVAARLHFFPVLCAAVGGFAAHACLPPRFRLAFFALLSLAVVVFVLGWPNGFIVVGVGSGLIALCYLPLPFAARVAAVCLAALALAVLRLDLNRPFWAVLGSMFMFRMVIYLHELRRQPARPPLMMTLAYFFPFQNVCFLFFPILDFRTFRDTYRPEFRWQEVQEAIVFLVRGLSHLLAYRIIKYYVLPSPHQLDDAPHLALFLAANYALYLHVSGYFHIITGLFRLFGFGLPRTHHNYFLASSFTDIWRRINIPWKEFMAKLFFFPAFFALRRLGERAAVVVAALWVFVVTWLLHTYQAFWIAGRFPLSVYDAALWLVVGVLVAWNLLRDLERSRRPQAAPDESVRGAVVLAARVVGMFALVSFFWACWSTPGFLTLLRARLAGEQGLPGGGWVLAAIIALVGAGAIAKLAHDRLARRGLLRPWPPVRVAVVHTAVLGAAVPLTVPSVAGVFGPEAARRIGEVRRESVTPVEAAQAVQGYYEEIADAPVRAGAWLSALEGHPEPPRHVAYTDMSRPADDLLERELIPGWHGEVEGAELTINRFGMRDRDRTREKPPGTRRIAVVGSSLVMGYGVRDGETFTRLLEDRLNAGSPPGGPRYEVLNFATGMSYAIHRHALADRKVFGFSPDALYYVAHQDEFLGVVPHLAKLAVKGSELPYPQLREIARKAGVTRATPLGEAEARLQPHGREIAVAVYRSLAAECRRRGVLPVWVYLPVPGVAEPAGLKGELLRAAGEAGFVTADASGWGEGRPAREVMLTEADHHANALGHWLIAGELEALIRRRPELLGGR